MLTYDTFQRGLRWAERTHSRNFTAICLESGRFFTSLAATHSKGSTGNANSDWPILWPMVWQPGRPSQPLIVGRAIKGSLGPTAFLISSFTTASRKHCMTDPTFVGCE